MNQEHTLPDLIRLGIVDRLTDYPDTREFMNSIGYFYTHDPFHELNAVETDKGVLFFEFSTYGRRDLQAFLQHIADNFHQKEGQSFKVVNYYKLMRPSKQEAEAFLNSSRPFSLYDGKFLPEKARYLNQSIIEGKHPWKSFDIKWAYNPHTECKYFIQDNGLEYNVITTQMQRLLSIKELGSLSLSAEERKNRIPFLHQKQFEQLFGEAKRLSGDGFPLSEDQRRKIVSTADRILQNYITDSLDKESEKQRRTLKLKI